MDERSWRDIPCDIRPSRRKRYQWQRIFQYFGDLWFLHRCHENNCWEREHIYIGTPSQNNLDSYANDPSRRSRISGTLKGRPRPEDVRARISEGLQGNTNGHGGLGLPKPRRIVP